MMVGFFEKEILLPEYKTISMFFKIVKSSNAACISKSTNSRYNVFFKA